MAKERNILFFSDEGISRCFVSNIYSVLATKKRWWSLKRINRHFLDCCFESQSKFVERRGLPIPDDSRLVLFGNKDVDYPLLMHLSAVIKGQWFDLFTNRKTIGYYFVPAGAEVISKSSHNMILEDWLSFHNNFDPLTDLPGKTKHECRRIFSEIIQVIFKYDDANTAWKKARNIFKEAERRLVKLLDNDKYEKDDLIVALAKISTNRENLTCRSLYLKNQKDGEGENS